MINFQEFETEIYPEFALEYRIMWFMQSTIEWPHLKEAIYNATRMQHMWKVISLMTVTWKDYYVSIMTYTIGQNENSFLMCVGK